MTYRMNLKGLERIREVAALVVKTPTQKQLAAELHVSEAYVSRLLSEAMEDMRDGLPPRHYPNIEHAENPKAARLGVNKFHHRVSSKPRRKDSSQAELDALAALLRDPPCAT